MFYIRINIGGKKYKFMYATEESRQAYINKVCKSINMDVEFIHTFGLTLESCDDENKVIPTSQESKEMFVLGYFQGVVKVESNILNLWFDEYEKNHHQKGINNKVKTKNACIDKYIVKVDGTRKKEIIKIKKHN
jgi:hypothetical protein